MTRVHIPEDVLSAAHARSRARAERDWAEADRLRAEIEAAGWRVVDRGTDFALSPAAPPDIAEGDRVRYGSSASVPSRAGEPAVGAATVILVAADAPHAFDRQVRAVRAAAPAGTSLVIVANDPDDAQTAALEALDPRDGPTTEVVWASHRFNPAAALNAGIRRATGPIVVVLDPAVVPTGDIVTPLTTALDDASVRVAGGWGMAGADLRSLAEVPPGDVDTIANDAIAFRRSDHADLGPLDEGFRGTARLAAWWSLTLRDAGEGTPPRRAVAVDGFPAVRGTAEASPTLAEDAAGATDPAGLRADKRDFYRLLDRFGARPDLLRGPR